MPETETLTDEQITERIATLRTAAAHGDAKARAKIEAYDAGMAQIRATLERHQELSRLTREGPAEVARLTAAIGERERVIAAERRQLAEAQAAGLARIQALEAENETDGAARAEWTRTITAAARELYGATKGVNR